MIPQSEFNIALRIALTHTADCSTDNRPAYRPDLRVIFFEFPDADTMRIIGTNGARLAIVDMIVQHGQPTDSRVILAVADTRSLLAAMPTDGRVTVIPCGPDVMFLNGEVCQTYRMDGLQPGYIPDFGSILGRCPDSQAGELRVDCTYLEEAVLLCRRVADSVRILQADGTPLYLKPKLRTGLAAIRSVTIAIMYKGDTAV